ncbi:MAG: FliH/SctL family protein [Syntrophobacteraceae bacterium]
MSNLLKKNLEPEIAAFGFPIIQKAPGGSKMASINGDKQSAEPEVNSEQLYRTKLLDLERRNHEIEKEAYGKGFSQGEKDGFEYGHKAVQVIKSQLERIAQNMEALPAKVQDDYREWLIRTSIRIARQIVNREVQTSPEIVARTVNALLEEAKEHNTLIVYLNPSDLELIEKRAEMALWVNRKRFALKADRELERGGCRVESTLQLLDASMASQFENVEKHLLGGGASQSVAGGTDGE